MNKDKDNIKQIYDGSILDGRTIGSLKRKGLINNDGSISLRGLHTIDKYRNCPEIPIADIAKYAGKIITINENISSGCDNCGNTYTETYNLSAEKMAKEYNIYAEFINKKLACNWSPTYDIEYENGMGLKGIKNILINAVKREGSHFINGRYFDRRYVQNILISAMEQSLKGGSMGYTGTSYKYSITDTVSEISDLILENGENMFTLEVSISR
jgi:hypothetical protein